MARQQENEAKRRKLLWHEAGDNGVWLAGGKFSSYTPILVFIERDHNFNSKYHFKCMGTHGKYVDSQEFKFCGVCCDCQYAKNKVPLASLSYPSIETRNFKNSNRFYTLDAIENNNINFFDDFTNSLHFNQDIMVPIGCPHAFISSNEVLAMKEDIIERKTWAFLHELALDRQALEDQLHEGTNEASKRNKVVTPLSLSELNDAEQERYKEFKKELHDVFSFDIREESGNYAVSRSVVVEPNRSIMLPISWRIIQQENKIILQIQYREKYTNDKLESIEKSFYRNITVNLDNGKTYMSDIHSGKSHRNTLDEPTIEEITYSGNPFANLESKVAPYSIYEISLAIKKLGDIVADKMREKGYQVSRNSEANAYNGLMRFENSISNAVSKAINKQKIFYNAENGEYDTQMNDVINRIEYAEPMPFDDTSLLLGTHYKTLSTNIRRDLTETTDLFFMDTMQRQEEITNKWRADVTNKIINRYASSKLRKTPPQNASQSLITGLESEYGGFIPMPQMLIKCLSGTYGFYDNKQVIVTQLSRAAALNRFPSLGFLPACHSWGDLPVSMRRRIGKLPRDIQVKDLLALIKKEDDDFRLVSEPFSCSAAILAFEAVPDPESGTLNKLVSVGSKLLKELKMASTGSVGSWYRRRNMTIKANCITDLMPIAFALVSGSDVKQNSRNVSTALNVAFMLDDALSNGYSVYCNFNNRKQYPDFETSISLNKDSDEMLDDIFLPLMKEFTKEGKRWTTLLSFDNKNRRTIELIDKDIYERGYAESEPFDFVKTANKKADKQRRMPALPKNMTSIPESHKRNILDIKTEDKNIYGLSFSIGSNYSIDKRQWTKNKNKELSYLVDLSADIDVDEDTRKNAIKEINELLNELRNATLKFRKFFINNFYALDNGRESSWATMHDAEALYEWVYRTGITLPKSITRLRLDSHEGNKAKMNYKARKRSNKKEQNSR